MALKYTYTIGNTPIFARNTMYGPDDTPVLTEGNFLELDMENIFNEGEPLTLKTEVIEKIRTYLKNGSPHLGIKYKEQCFPALFVTEVSPDRPDSFTINCSMRFLTDAGSTTQFQSYVLTDTNCFVCDIETPTPPAEGTYVLTSTNGVLSWEAK